MSAKNKAVIDDGMCPDLIVGADFDGFTGIPIIKKPEEIIIPKRIVPFSKSKEATDALDAIGFFEMDIDFAEILRNTTMYSELLKGKIVITPDCSLYYGAPYAVAMANIYRDRAIGYFLQKNGAYVIPRIRWSNEITFTDSLFPDKLAFLGVEKHGIYAIGTYGCIQTKEEKRVFKLGLKAMIEELEPEVVLVYGAMPKDVFEEFMGLTRFVRYDDWTTLCHKEASHG